MLGDLILRITAQVDSVLTGLSATRTAFDATSRAIQQQSNVIRTNLTASIQGAQRQINALQAAIAARGFFGNPAQTRADQAAIARLKKAIEEYKQQIQSLGPAVAAFAQQQRAAFRQVEAASRAALQNVVNVGSIFRQVGATVRTVGIGLTLVAASLIAGFADLTTTGRQFEQTMDIVVSVVGEFQVAGGRASETFSNLTQTIRKLGETTNFTASQVAEAARALGQAGLIGAQVTDALAGTVNLARAGMLELARAAEIAADFMNAFQLEGREVERVADAMAAAAANSNTTIEQLANAFSFAAPVAAALNQSIEGTAAALAVLANSGIKSSRAGTGLAQILSALIRKTEDTTALMKKYGSSFDAVNPQVRSLTEIVAEFNRVNVSAADVMEFFGERAGRAMIALQNAPIETIEQLSNTIENSLGEALVQATIRWDNLAGATANFISVIESIKLTVFNSVKDDMILALNSISESLRALSDAIAEGPFAKMVRPITYATAALTAFIGVAGLVAITMGTLVAWWGGAAAAIASMGISILASNSALETAALAEQKAAAEAARLAVSNLAAARSYTALRTAVTAHTAAQRRAAAAQAILTGLMGRPTTLLGLLQSHLAQAAGWVTKLGSGLLRLSIPIALVTTLVLALVAAFEISPDFQAYESGIGLLSTLAAVIKDNVVAGFEGLVDVAQTVAGWFSELWGLGKGLTSVWATVATYLGAKPESSAWEVLVASVRQLLGAFSVLAEMVGPAVGKVLGVLAGIVGGVLYGAFQAIVLLLTGFVTALNSVISAVAVATGWLVDITSALAGHTKEVGTLEAAYDSLNTRLTTSSTNYIKLLKGIEDTNEETDKAVSGLGKLASAMQKKGDLSSKELSDMADLLDAYGDYASVSNQAIATYQEQIKQLEEAKKQYAGNTQALKLIGLNIDVLNAKIERSKEAVESLTKSEIEHGKVLKDLAQTKREEAAAAKLEEEAIAEREATLAAAASADKEYAKMTEGLSLARLNAYEREITKIKQAIEASKELVRVSLLGKKAELEASQQRQAAAEKTLSLRPAGRERTQTEILALEESITKERNSQLSLQQQIDEMTATQAEYTAVKREELRKAQADQAQKQSDFIRDQRIEVIKLSEDKIKIAEAEAAKFLDVERRKIDATFIMTDAATQEQKRKALQAAEELAKAKVEDARTQVAEEKAKKEAEEAKKRAKELKQAKDDELSLEEAIVKEGLKKVQNMQQLIAMHQFLHAMQRQRELEAANAVRAVFAERRRIERLQAAVDASPANENMARGLRAAQERLRLEEAFAGKKLNQAGINPETHQLFTTLVDGVTMLSESTGIVLDVIKGTLIDSLQVQRDILAAILARMQATVQVAGAVAPAIAAPGVQALAQPPAEGQTPTNTPAPTPPATSFEDKAQAAADAAYIAAGGEVGESAPRHTNVEEQHARERKQQAAQHAASEAYRKAYFEEKQAKEKQDQIEFMRQAEANRQRAIAERSTTSGPTATGTPTPRSEGSPFGAGPPNMGSGEMFGEAPEAEITKPVMTGDVEAVTPERMAEIARNQAARKAEFRRKSEEARAQATESRMQRLLGGESEPLASEEAVFEPRLAAQYDKERAAQEWGDNISKFAREDQLRQIQEANAAKDAAKIVEGRNALDAVVNDPTDYMGVEGPRPDAMSSPQRRLAPGQTEVGSDLGGLLHNVLSSLDTLLKSGSNVQSQLAATTQSPGVQVLAPGREGQQAGAQVLTDNRQVSVEVNSTVDMAVMEQTVRRVLNESGFSAV